jgi:hypothetical protein
MTQIKSVVFQDAEAWLRENAPDMYVDGIAAVHRAGVFQPDGITEYVDYEENDSLTKGKSMADHIAALQKLCELVDGKKLFVGSVNGSVDLTEPCNWDVEVVDAFFQLLYHGEVIYG